MFISAFSPAIDKADPGYVTNWEDLTVIIEESVNANITCIYGKG